MQKKNKKNNFSVFLAPFWQNSLRFFIYFFIIFIFISFLSIDNKNYSDNEEIIFFFKLLDSFNKLISYFTDYKSLNIPDIFFTVLIVSLLFIFFTLVVSSIAAIKELNYFKTSFFIRIFLFTMNIIPIALSQHVLLKKFGFKFIYFFIIYLILFSLFNLLKIKINSIKINDANNIKILGRNLSQRFNNVILCIVQKINSSISEIIIIGITIFIILLPFFPGGFDMRELLMDNFSHFLSFCFYIVLFNSITFFTVEYCINIYRDEYKKNYNKYYFMYNNDVYKRIIFTLKNTSSQMLEKIKKNISWLVMFIIAIDGIFDKTEGLGAKLLNGFEDQNIFNGAITLIENIFYLLLVMYLINLIFDIIINYINRNNKKDGNEKNEIQVILNKELNQNVVPNNKPILKKIFISLSIIIGFIMYFNIFVFNQKNYPFVGYYDFTANKTKTVGDLFKNYRIDEKRCSTELIEKYRMIPLCEEAENNNGFYITQLEIERNKMNDNGEIIEKKRMKIVPYFDKRGRGNYYFIQGNSNNRNFDISIDDYIIDINRTHKYEKISNVLYLNKMIEYSLVAYKAPPKTTYERPLYLIASYYLFYFFTLLIIVISIVIFINYIITKYLFIYKYKYENSTIIKIFSACYKNIVLFFNNINVIVIFLLVNMLFRNYQSVNILENQSFLNNIICYSLVQILITVMFSDSYLSEITMFANRIKKTKEFNYYKLIGMERKRKFNIYNKKYGHNFLSKLICQNILFVFNINWFILYAFDAWPRFTDYIGITYSISFENIFTKIIRNEGVYTGTGNIILLVIFNIIIFGIYYIYQKRISSGMK